MQNNYVSIENKNKTRTSKMENRTSEKTQFHRIYDVILIHLRIGHTRYKYGISVYKKIRPDPLQMVCSVQLTFKHQHCRLNADKQMATARNRNNIAEFLHRSTIGRDEYRRDI